MAQTGLALRALASGLRAALRRTANRLAARAAAWGPAPARILREPEPQAVGSYAAAQALLASRPMIAGHGLDPGRSPWDLRSLGPAALADLHGFQFLDDLAAAGDAKARALARAWLLGWAERYGTGRGPGWMPETTGRRVVRWLAHAGFVLRDLEPADRRRVLRALGTQARLLGWRWRAAPAGLPRFEALTGWVQTGLALAGRERALTRAVRAMGRECARAVGADGGIASRNPEELMEVFVLLVWVARSLEAAGKIPDPRHVAAIRRIAPALRTLRMGDGSLARFHGGRAGPEGRLDQALADARVRGAARREPTMGFLRLAAGRTVVVLDAGRPPGGRRSSAAHAGTLAFEMSSGRRPVVVSIGPGTGFGPDWEMPARGTAAHSTLMVERTNSSRFVQGGLAGRVLAGRLAETPQTVTVAREDDPTGAFVLATHDGYVATHGLVHARRLFLSPDGRDLRGEDALSAETEAQKRIFSRTVAGAPRLGVAVSVLFHLHPDVEAALMPGGGVELRLPSSETWVFRQSGGSLELAESAFLDHARARQRAARQIVVTVRVVEFAGRVTWAIRRTGEGDRFVRDTVLEAEDQPGA